MSSTIAAYYPPSVVDSVTTQWIPMTTTNQYDSGASSYWSPHGKGMAAWGYNDETRSWSGHWWPPEATLSFRSTIEVVDTFHTKFSIGPFAGCPASWSTVSVATSPSSIGTTCCPPSYILELVSGTSANCYSALASTEVLTFLAFATPSGNLTFSSAYALADFVTETAVLVTFTTTRTAAPPYTVYAGALKGWNFVVTGDSTGNSSSVGANTCPAAAAPSKIPTGAVAGLAVASIVAGISTVTALVFGWMLLARRRRNGNGPADPTIQADNKTKTPPGASGMHGARSEFPPAAGSPRQHDHNEHHYPEPATGFPQQYYHPVQLSELGAVASPQEMNGSRHGY